MSIKTYYEVLTNNVFGLRIASIAVAAGFASFLLQVEGLVITGGCRYVLFSEWFDADCRWVSYLPLLVGFLLGCFAVSVSLKNSEYEVSDLGKMLRLISGLTFFASGNLAKSSFLFRSLYWFFWTCFLCMAPLAIWLSLDIETYVLGERNLFPIVTMAVLALVFLHFFLVTLSSGLIHRMK